MTAPAMPEELSTTSTRLPAMLRATHGELLVVCVLLLGVFASRQSGALPGRVIRILDIVLVAAALVLVLRASRSGRLARASHGMVAAASVVVAVVGVAISSVTLQRIAIGMSAYVLAVIFVLVITLVLNQRHVAGDTLFGALAAYLALAVLFAMVFTVIARVDPSAFEPPQPVVDGQTDLYYFSFVTVTSLGYGDIAPASDLTRFLAPLESIIGAFLIAALAGRIVGLLVAQMADTPRRLDELTRAVERLDPGRSPDRDPRTGD